jgi:hypothetical protein
MSLWLEKKGQITLPTPLMQIFRLPQKHLLDEPLAACLGWSSEHEK